MHDEGCRPFPEMQDGRCLLAILAPHEKAGNVAGTSLRIKRGRPLDGLDN